ncbi:hypothetical protein CCUS01_11536 [Colletotrichum cuscutae]|uniref:Uncharacterized protein n=1 Tax=Colletotrichum cuscutae TaxID=1209917 RepID=A0AAI9XHM6_9PEZI|nr:hypothetical protein CCUS01_11536 [Colletotrichum cuscutae]
MSSVRCSENQNSTDCLLRALLDVLAEQNPAPDKGIDWDPITFGFTLLIGLVAAMIALATVFQAVVAGGKGGRRANARAIGRWSKYTTRKWIFSEMSWSYTALTPMLRLSDMEDQLEKAIESQKLRVEQQRHEEAKQEASSFRATAISHRTSYVASHPATWLGLLEAAGLENFDAFHLAPSTADYLPDDFMAAPAFADVGAIVVIAATAGIQRFDAGTDSYPIIIGQGFQFDFRQHPALGIIGAFSDHRRVHDSALPPNPGVEIFREALLHSLGRIEQRDKRSWDSRTNTRIEFHQSSLPSRPSIPVNAGIDCFIPADTILRQYAEPIVTFLWAKSPKFLPALFPAPPWGEYSPFTVIALNGRFWTQVRLDGILESDWEQPSRVFSVEEDPECHGIALLEGPGSAHYVEPQSGKAYLGRVDPTVLRMCMSLLYDPEKLRQKFSSFAFEKRQQLRRQVYRQLEQADDYLAKFDNIEIRIQLLSDTSLILSRAGSLSEKGLLGVPPKSGSTSEESERQQKSTTVRSYHFEMLQALGNLTDGFEFGQHSLIATLKIEPSHPVRSESRHGMDDLRNHLRTKFFARSPGQRELQITPEDQTYLDHFKRQLERPRSQLPDLLGPGHDWPSEFFNSHQILRRLATIVGCHSELRNEDREKDKFFQSLDDAIILRTLLIGLLFYTALDNSEVLRSGVWDRVVPVI